MMELLANEAQTRLNITLTAAQLAQFQLYYEQLVDWNTRINLTSIIEYEAVQIRHFLDSLTLASPRLRGDVKPFDLANASLIDIGAGAGFPGLPLKIVYPKLRLTMSDSVGKKVNFLKQVAQALGFDDVRVITNRAEELGQNSTYRQKFDVATGRAVAVLPILAEYCLPLCKVGGIFIAPKKGDLSAEIASADTAFKKLGGKLRTTPAFDLPDDQPGERRLLVADKISSTPPGYPRRVGLPSQKPIT